MSVLDTGYFPGCHSHSEHNWELMRRGLHLPTGNFSRIIVPKVNRAFPFLIALFMTMLKINGD